MKNISIDKVKSDRSAEHETKELYNNINNIRDPEILRGVIQLAQFALIKCEASTGQLKQEVNEMASDPKIQLYVLSHLDDPFTIECLICPQDGTSYFDIKEQFSYVTEVNLEAVISEELFTSVIIELRNSENKSLVDAYNKYLVNSFDEIQLEEGYDIKPQQRKYDFQQYIRKNGIELPDLDI